MTRFGPRVNTLPSYRDPRGITHVRSDIGGAFRLTMCERNRPEDVDVYDSHDLEPCDALTTCLVCWVLL